MLEMHPLIKYQQMLSMEIIKIKKYNFHKKSYHQINFIKFFHYDLINNFIFYLSIFFNNYFNLMHK